MRAVTVIVAVALLAGVGCDTVIPGKAVPGALATPGHGGPVQLRFRSVIQQVATGPSDPSTANGDKTARQSTDTTMQQNALNNLNCLTGAKDPLIDQDDPSLPLVACAEDDGQKFILGPVILDGHQVASATAGRNPNGTDYVVNLTFTSAGAATWADYTATHVGDSVAVVLNTAVVSAETIQEAIPGGNTQISGDFTQAQAEHLARELRGG
ncbi:MAG TPA: precorrin-3B C(17)-methyltransferase [Pseudonocardiaceae bacterium]|nr:precorrin-3B C(17)-methyltransferase [Pseudonocardiaceae bacterium]